ncbi:hypothetical protein EBB59_06585 [Lysobacter pythonis]|uniref:Uncharacterized protein n=1 Tax=Solilutibacter pythonis TaxID=2483112 RepID=A0A3M2HY71_9GAMM|nr:zeta toxin family protein [Lysobacter pythonis]RMH93195.1 hypothetical protein EBB59_06585 [Lysobacter pythonis]
MSAPTDRLDQKTHARVLSEKVIPESGLSEVSSQAKPKAVILAGQPGAGKGGLARTAEIELFNDVVKIDPDELRDHHPDVKQFRKARPYTWSSQTQHDAGQWAEELLDATVAGKKHLIFDTTLSNGEWSSQLIKDLQAKGYEVEVRAVAAHRLESEHGVDERFAKKLDAEGYGRHVPKGARDAIYDKLPASLDMVHDRTDVPIRLFNREGVALYDSRTSTQSPGAALEAAREARLRDPAITHGLRDGWREQQAWHRDLPQTLPNNQRIDSPTRANLLAERSANQVAERVDRAALEAVEVDHRTRIRPTRIRAGSALGIAGLALDAYDAANSLRTSQRLRGEGNATAADSELIHFGSRTVGGFAGAGLGMAAGAAAGVETGPGLLVTGAIGGIAGAFAGDKIAAWTDDRRIYRQHDRQGNTWTYDPDQPTLGWQREAPIDASNDHIDNPTRGRLRASPALANELNHQATRTSVERVLGSPPSQRDPFTQPALANDAPSITPANWVRDADGDTWRREVVVAYLEHGLRQTRIDAAGPERAAELDRAAAQTVLHNAANSPAAIAARYEDAYARNGWAAYGAMPEAVQRARVDPDTLVASDDNRYQRRANGEWVSDGLFHDATATGNLRAELDATREVVRATLPPPRAVRTPPPMTPEAHVRDTVLGAYANAGTTPDAERLAASVAAVRVTWAAHGLDPNTTALQLQRGANGRYDQDSPIGSLRLDADGKTYVIAAVTTAEEIRRAQMPPPHIEIGPPPATPPHSDDTPTPAGTPEHPPHAPPTAAKTPQDPSDALIERYFAAMQAGDREGMRAASIAFVDSERGQHIIAQSRERIAQQQRQLPGRDNPLFVQALQHLERLGPEAARYTDQADMERIAGAIALEAKRNRLPAIDTIIPTRDGELMATWTNPRNDMLRHDATVDPILASIQPLERNFQQLEVETQRQEQQELQQEQQRQMSAQHGMSR